MIFISFSGEERYTVVKNLIYHLDNFNLEYWYDNYNLTLGDIKRQEIFSNGIDKSQYAIIIYSKNFHHHPSAVEEEKYIFDLFQKKQLKIFPILYKVKFQELPSNTRQYLENIIYNEIDDSSNLYLTLNQILIRILKEKNNLHYNQKFKFTNDFSQKIPDEFLKKELEFFIALEEQELNLKIVTLKIIFDYLFLIKNIIHEQDFECKIFTYLIQKINYSLKYNFKEIEILSVITFHYINLLTNS